MFFSILLVKGDVDRARQLGDFLQLALPQARIAYAQTVQQAAYQVAQQDFDVVLSAWQLADGSALEVLAHIPRSLALVIVQAGQEAQAAHAMRCGFADFAVRDGQDNFRLTLPAQIHALLDRIRLQQARQQAEREVERLAYTDDLTGLPNRRAMLSYLNHCLLPVAASQPGYGVVLLLGVDGFKDINDAMGHAFGDQVLAYLGRCISQWSCPEDLVGRVGGDEFMIVMPSWAADAQQARMRGAAVAQSLQSQIAQPLMLQGRNVRLSASVGVAEFGPQTLAVETLVQQVSMALHQGKAVGKGVWRLFSPQLQESVTHRAAMEADMHRALEHDEFVLHFQPLVQRDGQILGAEALVRWQHPVKGLIPPGVFIPFAEQAGLIAAIDQRVLKLACQQLHAWAQHPVLAQWTLSVNLSAQEFLHVNFVARIQDVLRETQALPQRLKLELTESLMLQDVDQSVEKMNTMAQWGVRFSLDDFGTGYSSLAYLKRLPLSQLKLDRSFVQGALEDRRDAAIVSSVIDLGHCLGLEVVAEGVETAAQRDFLVQAGCLNFQGYFFGRPMLAAQLQEFALA